MRRGILQVGCYLYEQQNFYQKNMKQFTLVAAMSLMALGLTSCYKHRIKGEGNVVSETRIVSDFGKVEANGSTSIVIVKDNDYKVVVTGYSNLVPMYKTKVKGDKLVLQYDDKYWNVKNDNITVEVHTPYFDRLSLNGSGDVTVHSGFVQDNFGADINGSGDITISNNEYGSLKAEINGSGTFNAETCEVDDVNAEISGSGNIYVKVFNHLRVRISGSGDVYYRGNPATTDIEISGSGKVQKRN